MSCNPVSDWNVPFFFPDVAIVSLMLPSSECESIAGSHNFAYQFIETIKISMQINALLMTLLGIMMAFRVGLMLVALDSEPVNYLLSGGAERFVIPSRPSNMPFHLAVKRGFPSKMLNY